MNPRAFELYKELEPYLIFNEEKCCDELKKDVPEEIKEKFQRFQKIASCEIIEDKNKKSNII